MIIKEKKNDITSEKLEKRRFHNSLVNIDIRLPSIFFDFNFLKRLDISALYIYFKVQSTFLRFCIKKKI